MLNSIPSVWMQQICAYKCPFPVVPLGHFLAFLQGPIHDLRSTQELLRDLHKLYVGLAHVLQY